MISTVLSAQVLWLLMMVQCQRDGRTFNLALIAFFRALESLAECTSNIGIMGAASHRVCVHLAQLIMDGGSIAGGSASILKVVKKLRRLQAHLWKQLMVGAGELSL